MEQRDMFVELTEDSLTEVTGKLIRTALGVIAQCDVNLKGGRIPSLGQELETLDKIGGLMLAGKLVVSEVLTKEEDSGTEADSPNRD